MRLYLYLFFLFLSLSFVAVGSVPLKQLKAKPVQAKQVVHNDTTKVSPRFFDKAALQRYSAQQEFQYGTGYVGESLWTKFWRWFWNLFDNGEKKMALSVLDIIIKYVLIGLGVAALVFLIFKLIGIDAFKALGRKSKNVALPYDESVENIYEIDLDAEIEKATAQQNYRLAVRLLYLRLLKQLSDASLIRWDITKTNSIYIDELTNAEQRLAFILLTRQFEYVWYGEFVIDAQVFKKISTSFTGFKIRMA